MKKTISELLEFGIINTEYGDDLENDFERIRKLKPKKISEIRYVNFMMPYRYFIV